MPGEWVGRGAETLQLRGTPERGHLGTLLEGRSPITGDELPGGRGRRPSNAGFDLTFTAPKSVSVLLAIGDERVRTAILEAQDRGVRAGFDYLERNECFARRGRDGVDVIHAQGFVGGAYVQEMARSGDPHLHTHVVIANRVRADDGRWTAPDMRPVYAAAKTAGTIAEAVLRADLTRSLGVRWKDVVNGTAEIERVPQTVLEHFSQRHSEIVELAAVRGWNTERGVEEIQRETRDRKPQIDRDVARERWRARAAEFDFGQPQLNTVMRRPRVRRDPGYEKDLRRRLAGPNGLTRQESTFTRRALIQAIAEAYPEGIDAEELEQRADDFLKANGIRVVDRAGHEPARFTTLDMLATEARLVDLATEEVPDPRLPSDDLIEQVIAASKHLGPDQLEAVRYLLSGNQRTRLLEARAGYGKTTALQAVALALDRAGIPVVGTAWQGQAARTLQAEAGIRSMTAARLLNQIQRARQPIPPGAVLVVDEAAQMPTRALAELLEEVTRRRGRLILVGDRDQLPPIDAGGAFTSLASRLDVAELTENRRQRTDLQRQIAADLAAGRASEALALLDKNGRFESYDDARAAREILIEDWVETSLRSPDRSLILAHDRRDVRALNELARERLDRAGLLGAQRITAQGREWASGDRLLCRRNNYRPDIDVRNGTRGTVISVDAINERLLVRTDEGRRVFLSADYLQHVEYGYASTGHASQGQTVDRTYLLASPDRGGREWGYVAGSRHRIDLRVYTVSRDPDDARRELERTWQRSQAKALALDRMPVERRDRALARFRRREREREVPPPPTATPTERRRGERGRPPPEREPPDRGRDEPDPQERDRDELDRGDDDDRGL